MVLTRSMGAGEALAGDLWLLERGTFDVDKYIRLKCPAMSEKGVKKLRQELIDLKNAFISFSKKNVHDEYKNFITATRDISGLETSLFKVRNFLSNQVAIIHGLLEQPRITAATSEENEDDEYFDDDDDDKEEEEEKEVPLKKYVPSPWEERFVALLDKLQVLLAEKKTKEAVATLEEGEKLFLKHGPEELNADMLRSTLFSMRERLVEELIESTGKASVRRTELRSTCSVLERLGEGPRAHTLLLVSHRSRLLYNIKGMRRSESSYGGAYTAALSQLVFSTIALALKDSITIFGGKLDYGSNLILWTREVTEKFVDLLQKSVLSSSAAAGGLRAAAECVHIALGHCALLEREGLALCPHLSSLLKPSVQQAVSANLKRIGRMTLALAAADDWKLIEPLHDPRLGKRASYQNAEGIHVRLSNSAHVFNVMIEEFLLGVVPLTSFSLAHSVFESLAQLYERYVAFLIKALPIDGNPGGGKNIKVATTLSQQLVILGNATALSEEILPTVSRKLSDVQRRLGKLDKGSTEEEEEEWRLCLRQSSDNVRSTICGMFTNEILFEKSEIPLLTPKLFSINEDEHWQNEPVPSPPFQELLAKAMAVAKTGEEALRGQERVCHLLITEFLVNVVNTILNNEDFWNEVEEGPIVFSLLGLQKFVFDMQFVVQVACEGQYSTEFLYKVVADNIAKATNAFALNDGDPMSVLPDDKWFVEMAQVAYQKLAYK